MSQQLLTTIGQTVKDNSRIFLTAAMLGILSSSIFIAPSQAAKIVYDPQNTAEAVKILKESQNITNTLGKQLGLSEKDLKNINDTINHYTTLIEKHQKAIETVMAQHGGYIGGKISTTTDENGNEIEISTADKWLGAMIPAMTDANGKITFNAKNIARMAATGAILSNNKQVLEAFAKITQELDKSEKELQELLKKNAELGVDNGTLAAQQLNNQIKGLETHIAGLHAQMDAIQGQAKVLQSQADAQDKKNEYTEGQTRAQATKDYIEETTKQYESSEENFAIGHPW